MEPTLPESKTIFKNRTSRWSTRHGATQGHMTEASATTAWCFRFPSHLNDHVTVICWTSVDPGGFRESAGHQSWLQHQWWDLWGGSALFYLFHPLCLISILTIKCPKPFQVPLYCPLCEVPAPARKVTVRGLCELSIFDKWSHSILVAIDHVQGCTTTSSERMGNRCTLGIGTLFSTTTPASPPGFGTTGRTTEVWLSAFLQRRLSF